MMPPPRKTFAALQWDSVHVNSADCIGQEIVE
jgi:hypothetical protein